jgi:hypothetical protein
MPTFVDSQGVRRYSSIPSLTASIAQEFGAQPLSEESYPRYAEGVDTAVDALSSATPSGEDVRKRFTNPDGTWMTPDEMMEADRSKAPLSTFLWSPIREIQDLYGAVGDIPQGISNFFAGDPRYNVGGREYTEEQMAALSNDVAVPLAPTTYGAGNEYPVLAREGIEPDVVEALRWADGTYATQAQFDAVQATDPAMQPTLSEDFTRMEFPDGSTVPFEKIFDGEGNPVIDFEQIEATEVPEGVGGRGWIYMVDMPDGIPMPARDFHASFDQATGLAEQTNKGFLGLNNANPQPLSEALGSGRNFFDWLANDSGGNVTDVIANSLPWMFKKTMFPLVIGQTLEAAAEGNGMQRYEPGTWDWTTGTGQPVREDKDAFQRVGEFIYPTAQAAIEFFRTDGRGFGARNPTRAQRLANQQQASGIKKFARDYGREVVEEMATDPFTEWSQSNWDEFYANVDPETGEKDVNTPFGERLLNAGKSIFVDTPLDSFLPIGVMTAGHSAINKGRGTDNPDATDWLAAAMEEDRSTNATEPLIGRAPGVPENHTAPEQTPIVPNYPQSNAPWAPGYTGVWNPVTNTVQAQPTGTSTRASQVAAPKINFADVLEGKATMAELRAQNGK